MDPDIRHRILEIAASHCRALADLLDTLALDSQLQNRPVEHDLFTHFATDQLLLSKRLAATIR